MTCYLEKEVPFGEGLDFDPEELFREIVEKVLDYAECPYEASVSLLITDNEGIRDINSTQRGIDAPTDVLSFPMVEYEEAGDFSCIDESSDCFDYDSGELCLGDIVLSADRIRSQAEEYGHGIKREYAFLIVHSLLHLMGYDHMEDGDKEIMEEEQRKIMSLLNINR